MKKFFLRHWHYLLVIFPLLIFIFSIWDRNFYIGGDVMVPLNPANNIQKMFLWDNGLESFQYVGFFWFAFYYLFSLIGLSAFVIQKILLVLLLIIGFVFTYLSYKELFRDTKYSNAKLAFLAAVIFTFNPIYFLLAGGGLFLYGFPVCFYFLIKFLQKGKILYAVLFSLLLNFFFFTDLPQPKLLIIFFIASLFLILVYHQIRKLNFKDLFGRLFIIFLLSFLLNAWVFIPLLYSLFLGAGASFVKGIGSFDAQADFKIATLTYITRFFNYNIVRYYPHLEHFLTSPIFVIWTFAQWVILVVGIFMAVKNKKDAKIICLLVLPIIFFIFIAKGANSPLGQFYRAIVTHFPLAKILRTTSTVITGAVIFYAFSLSISAYYLAKKKKVIVYFIIIILNIVIFYPLYFGYKFYNPIGRASDQKGYSIPYQYYETGKWLDGIKEDAKVLSIPLIRSYVEKDWRYFGPDILSWITIKPLNPLIYREGFFGLSGASSKDTYSVPKNCGVYSLNNIQYVLFQKDTIGAENLYEGLEFGDLVTSNNYFDLYKIKNECFLPHFYIPQNTIYSNGDIEGLASIVGFGDYKIRLGIYLNDIDGLTDSKINELKNRADEVFVNGKLKDKIGEEELGSVPIGVNLPFVRWRPDHFLYPFVLKKEEYEKWKVRNEPEKLFEKQLFYAGKRISEMVTFNINGLTDSLLTNYEKEMTGALGVLKELKQDEDKDFVKLLVEYEGTLLGQRAKIKEIGDLKDWDNTFKELERQAEELKIKRDFSKLAYKLDVPKEGEYEIFVKEINGLTDYSLLGKKYFEKGTQELILPMSGISENLVDENLKIKSYSPNSIYRISFDYQAPRGGSFFVAEGKAGELAETNLRSTDNELKHFEMFFRSSVKAEEGNIHLSLSIAQEENLKVERIYQPEMVLRLNNTDTRNQILDTRKAIPKITFVKINPTKYKVKVEGAKEPYNLVFSESFHQGWKAYINGVQSSKFKVQSDYGEILASYFDGEIKEGTHKNIFLERATFETWGRKPLPEGRHLLVNGYANSWYIKPEDAGGQENYELIIEFWPQRLFYLGFGISLTTLLGCLGYLGIGFFENSVKLKVR